MKKFDSILKQAGEIQHFHNLDVNQEWGAFLDMVQASDQDKKTPDINPAKKRSTFVYYITRAVAAIFVIMLLFIFTLKPKESNRIQYQANQENDIITLADGSTVTLAHNALIDYPRHFIEQHTRYIKVEGKATFDVTRSILPFIVDYDSIRVEVLGTTFRLYKQNNTIFIKNIEGSVKVYSRYDRSNFVILKENDEFEYVNGQFTDVLAPKAQESEIVLLQVNTETPKQSQSNKNIDISNGYNSPYYATYKLGSILKEYFAKQHRKSVKIDKKFKYDAEINVRLNLQESVESILSDLKSQGLINFKKGSCPDCVIITAPDKEM